MTRSEQKYEKAIKMIRKEYTKAQAACYVQKPMAYALYQVWKYYDSHEKPRIQTEEERENV